MLFQRASSRLLTSLLRSRAYKTVERPSVRPSHHSTAAALCGEFAAERRAGGRYRSTAAGAGRPLAAEPQHGPQHGA